MERSRWETSFTSFRRTLVGLKQPRSCALDLHGDGFRRTLVGLKHAVVDEEPLGEPVSDEPSWG